MAETLEKDIYTQFSKKELIDVARELEISVAGNETTRSLASIILKDLDENGIPENLDEISDGLFELLVTADFIDEDGNVVESSEDETAVPQDDIVEMEIPDWICFSYADPRDPACNKCKLYNPCWQKRLTVRPECYGKRYSANEPECQVCIEAPYCKKETENG